MSLLSSFRDWLPYPVYPFKGGPADGQSLAVTLYETNRGMGPLPIWRVLDPPPGLPRPNDGVPDSQSIIVRVHLYRFIPVDHWNSGYYQYIEDKKG